MHLALILWPSTTPYYSVLQSTTPGLLCMQSTTPVLLCTAKYYSSPVLLCTTRYYSSTTLYCKVLKNYSSTTLYYTVLQRTTPVLLCTTKYYSSTTLYYKVLLQYYSVLHSTTTCYASTTLYYKAAFMIDVRRIWNVSFTTRGATGVILQRHEILHLPRKITVMIDPRQSHMKRHLQWAKKHESQSIFTKYCTCHAKWMPSLIRVTYETSFPMRGASTVTLQNLTKYCACHAKWISWLIRVTYETSFRMRGATRVTLHLHQILRLPRKMNLMIDPPHIWNVI